LCCGRTTQQERETRRLLESQKAQLSQLNQLGLNGYSSQGGGGGGDGGGGSGGSPYGSEIGTKLTIDAGVVQLEDSIAGEFMILTTLQ
jgi:hypothetical protein